MAEWSRTKGKSKKLSRGRIPLHIPEPGFLANPNHRVKIVLKVLFAYASMPQKNN